MKEHIHLISDVRPKGERKPTRPPGVESNRRSDWSDSSTDLRLGLDMVELSDTQWANTQPLEMELPRGC